ncbi:MAG: hypothetical protein DRJ01_03210 [Bacteroidetes bacterium]|nr:MAG: hypothetical protein DRJ01_03210 [Bacteroidota bacterium]
MRIKGNILYLLIIAQLLLINNYSFSQTYSATSIKVAYIYQFGKYIEWEEGNNDDYFRIGVLGKAKNEIIEINKLKKIKKLKDKPIKLLHFKHYDEITETEILFVSKELNYQIDTIYNKIKQYNTLLVTDNIGINRSMINFLNIKNTISFQINDKNIRKAKLVVAPQLLAIAKSKTELRDLYIKTEGELKNERVTVKKQKKEINNQKKIILSQNDEISKRKREIEYQNIEISKLTKKINKKNAKLSSLSKEINNQQNILKQRLNILKKQEKNINNQKSLIDNQKKEIEKQTNKLNDLNNNILLQQQKINSQKINLKKRDTKIKAQQIALFLFIAIIILVSILIFFIYRSYTIIKLSTKKLEEKNKAIEKQNFEIEQQKEELQSQRDEIQSQNSILKRVFNNIKIKNKELTDSIKYAQRIQQSIFPTDTIINELLPNSFILFQPKEILSGDFYFLKKHKVLNNKVNSEKIIISAVDCTGHGVPGALMSIVGKDLLDHSISELGLIKPSEILESLNTGIKNTFCQNNAGIVAKDGMDMALITIEQETNLLEFAGAKNPIYLIRNNSLSILKGDIYEIGNYEKSENIYTNHQLQLQKNDIIYLFSDGYADQFGGVSNKKLTYKTFQKILLEIHKKPLNEQRRILYDEFIRWKGENEQIDDVLIMGIKI